MIDGTSTKKLVYFVVDQSKVTADFDITVSGKYDVIDYGADNTNGGIDDIVVTENRDPFVFTVDIA